MLFVKRCFVDVKLASLGDGDSKQEFWTETVRDGELLHPAKLSECLSDFLRGRWFCLLLLIDRCVSAGKLNKGEGRRD